MEIVSGVCERCRWLYDIKVTTVLLGHFAVARWHIRT